MKYATLKIVALSYVLFTAAHAGAQENQPASTNRVWAACRHPVRVFGYGKSVNLSPLFDWWEHQPMTNRNLATDAEAGDVRPLIAWHRITGVKLADVGGSWLVNATIYTAPNIHTNARILLNHPPAAEEQSYYNLLSQLNAANEQIAATQRAYQADTNIIDRAERRAEAYRRSRSKVGPTGVQQNIAVARQRQLDADAAQSQLKQLQALRTQIHQQLNIIPTANGRYIIDLFAMAQGTDKKGQLIYDMGMIEPGP
ncbi:MAG TPA: hypothetical protein VF988_14860 [Verrucomicrobiae bacterium]